MLVTAIHRTCVQGILQSRVLDTLLVVATVVTLVGVVALSVCLRPAPGNLHTLGA